MHHFPNRADVRYWPKADIDHPFRRDRFCRYHCLIRCRSRQCDDAISSRFSAARRQYGHSLYGRNGPNGSGAWSSSCQRRRTMGNFKLGLVRSFRHWYHWAGPLATTCALIRAGPHPMLPQFANKRRNWPRLTPMSFWPWRRYTRAIATDHPHCTDRIRGRHRPGRRWTRR